MPRVSIENTGKDIDSVCGNQGNQNQSACRSEERRYEASDPIVDGETEASTRERLCNQIERKDKDVKLNDSKIHQGQQVREFGSGSQVNYNPKPPCGCECGIPSLFAGLLTLLAYYPMPGRIAV